MSVYLVLGPGRCGSSKVAEILHTHFGISMGSRFREPDNDNPIGYWEDLDFKDLNNAVLTGHMTFPEWEIRIGNLVKKRDKEHEHWGLKDPRLCYLVGFYLLQINCPLFIRCKRNIRYVVASMCKCYGWSKENAVKIAFEREVYLSRISDYLSPLIISFDTPKKDEQIIRELGDIADGKSSSSPQDENLAKA